MKARPLIFLSALSFMLLGMPGGPRAQPQDTGAAARRVIIFVWDGLRADDLTPGSSRSNMGFHASKSPTLMRVMMNAIGELLSSL